MTYTHEEILMALVSANSAYPKWGMDFFVETCRQLLDEVKALNNCKVCGQTIDQLCSDRCTQRFIDEGLEK